MLNESHTPLKSLKILETSLQYTAKIIYLLCDNGWEVFIFMSAHANSSTFTVFFVWIWFSHITDILQPVAGVVIWQGEADVSAPLPATADLSESLGHAGQEESETAQQDHEGKNQDQ